MVGQLGPSEIASIGMGNTLRMFLFILILSVSAGAMSLMAQAKGARDPIRMSLVTRQSLISGLVLSIFLGVLGIVIAKPILLLMDQSSNVEVINSAYLYLVIIFIGTPFLLLNFVIERLMQGAGDSLTPLYINVMMVILNIMFNYIFIFGWGLIPSYGIFGAAIGTLLARAISMLIGLYLFYSGKNVVKILEGSYRPNWAIINDIFSIGVPSGVQGILRRGANIFLVGLVTATSLGTYGAAALTIGWQIEQLIIQPIVGLNVAATSLIGQSLGKWQTSDALLIGKMIIIIGFVLCTLLGLPLLFFTDEIIALFDPSAHPLLYEGSYGFIKMLMISLPIASISVIITGNLRGAGDTMPAMYSTLIFRNLVTIVLAYIFAFTFHWDAMGIWIAVLVGRALDTIYMSRYWSSQAWLISAIKKTDIYRKHLFVLSQDALSSFLVQVRTPNMSAPGTRELIFDDRIEYHNVEMLQIVTFDEKGYNANPA